MPLITHNQKLKALLDKLKSSPGYLVKYSEIKSSLNYNLGRSLSWIGLMSLDLNTQEKHYFSYRLGNCREIKLPDFVLAWISHILICSYSIDFLNADIVISNDDLFLLSNIYFEHCEDFFKNVPVQISNQDIEKELYRVMNSIYCDQTQINNYDCNSTLIGRNLELFGSSLASYSDDDHEIFPQEALKEILGMSLNEYFKIALCVYGNLCDSQILRVENFTNKVESLNGLLTEENVTQFLKVTSTNYHNYREIDKRCNSCLLDANPKFIFNVLDMFPIIKTDFPLGDCEYVVPCFQKLGSGFFNSIYWKLINYYEEKGDKKRNHFTTLFGKIFEDYVGRLLTEFIPKTEPGIKMYDDKNPTLEFGDFLIEENNKVIYIECKARTPKLAFKKGKNNIELDKEFKEYIAQHMDQVIERIKESKTFPKLKRFSDKEIVPIIIYYDFPEVSSPKTIELSRNYMNNSLDDYDFHLFTVGEVESLCEQFKVNGVLETIRAYKTIRSQPLQVIHEHIQMPTVNSMYEFNSWLKNRTDILLNELKRPT